MVRCNKCGNCLAVLDFRAKNKGNRKKVKRFENKNACENPTAAKRARISEAERLVAAGHGGEIRGEYRPLPSGEEASIDPAARKTRPKEGRLKEDEFFDQKAFDEYLKAVNDCTKAAKDSPSADVKLEARTMIPKMRGLLDPSMKSEVDYAEATKDGSNILTKWQSGEAAGTRAFIPNLQFRDECYAALKIFSCAEEEAKQIPLEYVGMFGEDDGIGMYNQLVEIIGEQDKKCLPLVNMCLRAWLDRISNNEDGNIWADLSPLSFDNWKEEEMKKASARKHSGKTSYEMMMAVFGPESRGRNAADEPSKPRASEKGRSKTLKTNEPRTTSGSTRISKLQKLGEVVQKRLLRARLLRGNRRITKANEEVLAAIKESYEGELNANTNRSCHDAARRMEEILFSAGGAVRVVKTLLYFKDRAAVQEVARARDMMVDEKDMMKVSLRLLHLSIYQHSL